jgi:hypothetical protein
VGHKAEKITVLELQALLKAGEPTGEGEKTVKTTADVVKMAFKFKTDQAEIVQQALAKPKGELHRERGKADPVSDGSTIE